MDSTVNPQETLITNSSRVKIAEQRALSYILNNPKEAVNSAVFNEDSFVTQDYKEVYKAVELLINQGAEVSNISIIQKIADKSTLSVTDLKNLSLIKNPSDNLKDVIEDLNTSKIKKEASRLAQDLSRDLLKTELKVEDIEAKALEILTNVSRIEDEKTQAVLSWKEWLLSYREKFKQRQGKKQYPFGDPLLDKAIVRGAEPGTVGIISATTGMGKTTVVKYLQKCLENVGVNCLWLSLEMSGASQMDRKLSEKHKIPFDIISNPTDPQEFNKILDIIDQEIKEADENDTLGFSDRPSWNLAKLRQAIVEFLKRHRASYCVVIIDLLTMLDDFCKVKPGLNFAQSIELCMNLLSALAKETNTHIIGTVQFGRKADSVKIMDFDDIEYTKPSLNDLKNSNGLAERSRYVLGLHRPKAYAEKYLSNKEETKEMEDIISLMVLKQNEGPTPTLSYLFDPSTFTISPISTGYSNQDTQEIEQPESENHMV